MGHSCIKNHNVARVSKPDFHKVRVKYNPFKQDYNSLNGSFFRIPQHVEQVEAKYHVAVDRDRKNRD